jgi:mycothiol synthase
VNLRPPTLEDVPALTEFFRVLEAAGRDGVLEADIRDWLASPIFDPDADFRIALHGDAIVGWCDLWDQNRDHERFFLDARAHPDVPAAYAALLDWGIDRAGEQARPGAVVRAGGESTDTAFVNEVESRGFRLARHWFRMEADLTEEPPPPKWPNGISLRTFRRREARRVYDACNDAFADHWDFVPAAFDEWREFLINSSGFDPSLWFLAEDEDELAGFSVCRLERRPETGHVQILGVRPRWRRRGLGLALLLHSLRELRARGRTKADLGVDAENTTGAVRLYERAGMRVARRTDSYEKAVP